MTAIAIALFTLFTVYDGGATEVGIGDRRIKDIFFTEKVSFQKFVTKEKKVRLVLN